MTHDRWIRLERMNMKFEAVLKNILLYVFCLLNAIDMAQTLSFLRMGIESNPFAVQYPQLWFLFKFIFTFGFPIGLYQLDLHLERKKDDEFHGFLKALVGLTYLSILFADGFFLFIVLRNMSTLGRLV
jgi:hypothetical protein